MRSSSRGNVNVVTVRQHIPGMGGDWLRAVDTRETYDPFTLRNGRDPMNYPFSSRLREERTMVRPLLCSCNIGKIMIVE